MAVTNKTDAWSQRQEVMDKVAAITYMMAMEMWQLWSSQLAIGLNHIHPLLPTTLLHQQLLGILSLNIFGEERSGGSEERAIMHYYDVLLLWGLWYLQCTVLNVVCIHTSR